MKNCGDYIHFQIAERNLLGEMIKIVKKKVSLVDAIVWSNIWPSGTFGSDFCFGSFY